MANDLFRAAMAELFAMTLFVWCGCGTAVSSQAVHGFDSTSYDKNAFIATVSLAFGLAIAVLAYTIAPVSGGHINPAVTFAFVVSGKMPITTGLVYVAAQCAGAILGASIVWGTAVSTLSFQENPPFNTGMNSVNSDLTVGSAFLGEFMGTFLLVWTVIMTAVSSKSIAGNLAPIAIGWSVVLAHFLLIPFTGCGINPARSLGPMFLVAVTGGKAGLEGWWVFYTAPFAGAGAAVAVCKYIFEAFDDDKAEAEAELEKMREIPEGPSEMNA